MKKSIILLTLVALVFSGCRKEADYHPYIGETDKLAYDSYSSQFDYLWKCISTGYVFWDVDHTDWDAVYDEYMPKFQALDAKHEAGQDVTLMELGKLYKDAMGGMKDHHMNIMIKNLFPSPTDSYSYFNIRPGNIEVSQRDYYIESTAEEQANLQAFLDNLEAQYNLAVHESVSEYVDEIGRYVTYHYCLIILPDGRKVPYLWQSMAAIAPVMRTPGSAAANLIDHWLRAITETPREQLAGIILDNRANTGGYQDDLDYLVGTYLNERTEILKTRYKEGPGRLEHSVWTPYYIDPQTQYHRDITAENIPYVIICDINSVSMGEIEPMVIKAVLPTSHVVGERTFGGTGPLQPATCIDLNYGGPFGDILTLHHYIYTSSFESLIGGQVLEGIGCTPDQQVLRKNHNGDFKPQLDAAIEYIKMK
ncbi:MAG: hypothetical protein J5644_09805 [Bacteroidales bacterium]|nr:hypothetical protein [Bacteroidales bacterium]